MVVAAMTMVGNHDDDTDWLDAGLQRFHNLAGSSLADRPLPPPARCLRLLQRRRLRCPGSSATSSHCLTRKDFLGFKISKSSPLPLQGGSYEVQKKNSDQVFIINYLRYRCIDINN